MKRIPLRAACGCVVTLLACACSQADLYTDGVLSLEWLVDSSDEIYHVQVGASDANALPATKLLQVLKSRQGAAPLPEDQLSQLIRRWGPKAQNLRPRENEEWLLFVRGKNVGEHFVLRHVFRGINLSRPLKSYFTAAVTREGKPLGTRQEILDAVAARVRLRRQVPPCADRAAVDRLAGREGRPWKPEDRSDTGASYLKSHRGGTLIRINCNYWDENGPNNADTLLVRAVVPVEPEDHARLLELARQPSDSESSSAYFFPIMALVNFPGEETEACLKEILANWHPSDPGLRTTPARHVLLYFTYHLETTDPKNKPLLGQWRLEGRRERIEITFSHDQTFVASAFARPRREHPAFARPRREHEEPRHLWDGQGRWAVRDGKLSIMRTHAREGLNWNANGRELFRNKKIVEIRPSEIILEGGPLMKRPSIGSVQSSSEAGNP